MQGRERERESDVLWLCNDHTLEDHNSFYFGTHTQTHTNLVGDTHRLTVWCKTQTRVWVGLIKWMSTPGSELGRRKCAQPTYLPGDTVFSVGGRHTHTQSVAILIISKQLLWARWCVLCCVGGNQCWCVCVLWRLVGWVIQWQVIYRKSWRYLDTSIGCEKDSTSIIRN